MSIQQLPPDVIAQIKSSSTITSLNGVVLELVKNSLDASCSKVDITVDYSRGDCTVEDDGLGIPPLEFGSNGGLGKPHHSSKLNSPTHVHGGHGTFLASLSAVSLLSILSHHHLHKSHNSVTMHKSGIVARHTPSPVQHHVLFHDHGTRVSVRDLFGNMPVRVKQRAIASDNLQVHSKLWENLRRDIVSLLLAWPKNVSITARGTKPSDKIIIRRSSATSSFEPLQIGDTDIHNIPGILLQASYITSDERASWVPISGSTSNLAIDGAISLIPNATKHVQFLAFGIEPFTAQDSGSILYEDVNRWFSNSAFGNQEEAEELDAFEVERRARDRRYKGDGYTNRELKGGRKGVERWPMFYINIHQTGIARYRTLNVNDLFDDRRNTLGSVLELLRVVIHEFLARNNFRPRAVCEGHKKRPIDDFVPPDEAKERQSNVSTTVQQSTPKSRSSTLVASSPGRIKSGLKRIEDSRLGVGSDLPSMRRSFSGIESPFNSWSRVKMGRKADETKETAQRKLEAPSVDVVDGDNTQSLFMTTQPCSTPLIEKSGKLVRRPFEVVGSEFSPSDLSSVVDRTKIVDANGDSLVPWTNPINKVKSMVNTRTGLVLSDKMHIQETHSLVGTSIRLSSESRLRASSKHPIPWIDDVLKNWENPIFTPTEPSIPHVSADGLELKTQEIIHGQHHHCAQIDIENALKDTSSGLNGSISKEALRNAEIISQVDKKFILAKIPTRFSTDDSTNSLLVIIDQHAADERIRIESLLAEFLNYPLSAPASVLSSVNTSLLEKPLSFDISSKDAELFRSEKFHFSYWGLIYSQPTQTRLTITHLPPLISARLIANPKLLIHILRTEIYSYREHPTHHPPVSSASTWVDRVTHLPRGMLELLNSRACRSAIMFDDELSLEECKELVTRLAATRFPFMCAHGRVSLVPLGNVDAMGMAGGTWNRRKEVPDLHNDAEVGRGSFGFEWRKWMSRREIEPHVEEED
ncbi:DNA mismatch repair protein [Clarireedia jacksonii]